MVASVRSEEHTSDWSSDVCSSDLTQALSSQTAVINLFIVFFPFFFGLISVDGDTLNPALGYRQQEIAFFFNFFQESKKPAKTLGKCGVS